MPSGCILNVKFPSDRNLRKHIKDENAILAYYQKIKNGGVIVGRYIRMLYEVIIEGLEEGEVVYVKE